MNSNEVYVAIKNVGATSGMSAKATLLNEYDDPLFKEVLVAALDPFVTYGIAKIPPYSKGDDNCVFDEGTSKLLANLAQRKLTGNAARDALAAELARLAPPSAELLKMIITKDIRAGITAKTVNKVWPGLITTFDCMLAHKFDATRIKSWPQYVEPKLDGVRVLAFAINDEVKFYSRSGKEFTAFSHLSEQVISMLKASGVLQPVVLDGEVISGTFNKTVGDVRRKEEVAIDARYYIFSIMTLEQFKQGQHAFDYGTVRTYLRVRFSDVVNDYPGLGFLQSYKAHSVEEIMMIYRAIRDRGGEGVIVKNPSAKYVCKRSHGWMKIKGEESVDAEVCGAFEGTGKYEGMLGGLIIDVDGVEVRVGGGFSDEQRRTFWEAFQADLFRKGAAREIIGRIAEVEYHEKTPDGSLRHPRFLRWRDDKTLENNDMED